MVLEKNLCRLLIRRLLLDFLQLSMPLLPLPLHYLEQRGKMQAIGLLWQINIRWIPESRDARLSYIQLWHSHCS